MGNGLKRISGYDSYFLPNKISLRDGTSVIDSINYNFNANTGNLTSRSDVSNGRNEAFGYDNLNRLTSIMLNGGTTNTITYSPNGNINTKFDVGTYQYDKGNHAVSGITNQISSYNPPALDITNTSYNRVSSLTQQGSIVKELDFQYNADKQRNKSLYYENSVLKKTMYYVGNYEKEVINGGSTNEYDYIYTPEGLTVIALKTNGTSSLYYVQTDHLGSIRLVTNASKGIQTRYYYDAWGKQTLVSGTGITNRGYIGEEHLNDFGLINLNARLYDPVLGRFMGMDPYVSMPDFTQSYNRYGYGMNNPLKYTDANGEFSWLPLGFFVLFNYFMNAHNNASKNNNWAWNPIDWFRSTPNNPNPNGVLFTVGGSLSLSNLYGNVAVGNINMSMPAFGYSYGQGWGFGYNGDGNSSMYYPGYNYNAPEQAATRAIDNAMNVTPWDVGVEWLTGTGPRDRTFYGGDYFTELLKQHYHIQDVRNEMINRFQNGNFGPYEDNYKLNGIQGIGKYIMDYSTLLTGGITGNLAVTYLGSYDLSCSVLSVNGNSADVQFRVYNESTAASGFRPPWIGYTSWWQRNVGGLLNQIFQSGPMSKTTQTFIWNENLYW